MNHTMHGIIFSYGKPTGLGDLIAHRIPGSMPFGGNYRVVDFMLSNMVNASSCTASARVCWIIWATAAAGI